MGNADRERRSGRSATPRALRRRLFVVCEGKRTEPEYIRGLQRHLRNSMVEVQISEERGDPRRIVEIAKSGKERAHREAERLRDRSLEFDEVWCVFDHDQHERFEVACTMARDNGLQLAVSNPCIELWLLLHFRPSPGPRTRQNLQNMMGEYVRSYNKGVDFEQFQSNVESATRRAGELDRDAERMGEPGRNPTTGFYLLTESITRSSPA